MIATEAIFHLMRLSLSKPGGARICVHLAARKPRPSAGVRCRGHPRLRGRAEYLRLEAAGLDRTPAAQRRKGAGKEGPSLASSHGSNKKVWALPSEATCLCLASATRNEEQRPWGQETWVCWLLPWTRYLLSVSGPQHSPL